MYMTELDNPQLLNEVIASLEKQLGVTGIHKAGNGLEFFILRGELAGNPIAIKVPRDRVFSNVNDAHIESRTLLDQEFALMRHLEDKGIFQIPTPISDLDAAGFGALVMSYVPSDDSKPDEYKLGQLLAHIHSIDPPSVALSAQENEEIPELIPHRLERRWKELKAFVQDLPELPSFETLQAALENIRERKQLLHMDFREANLRTEQGNILAVVDWSNALIGHPALELARAAETGETGPKFLEGYASVKELPSVDEITEIIFRLDTATMLALVFLSEAPDPERAPILIARVKELFAELQQNI